MEPVTWAAVAGMLGFVSSFFGGNAKTKDQQAVSTMVPIYDNDGNYIGVGSYGQDDYSGWINNAHNGADGGYGNAYDANANADSVAAQKAANKGGFWGTLGSVANAVSNVVSASSNGNVVVPKGTNVVVPTSNTATTDKNPWGAVVIVFAVIAAILGIRYLLTDKKTPKRAYN